jgi:hypothetical protein
VSRARSALRAMRRHPMVSGPILVVLVALYLLGATHINFKRTASIPVPVPVYEIDAVSGSHHASLLNLPLGQPGVAQLPVPVDVDGDLVPDVTVAVNLIDPAGIIKNPPDVGSIVAPNIDIERVVKGVPLGSSPPLRITVKLTIKNPTAGVSSPDTTIRFGYDTGQGGSIPATFKAVLGGLQNLFNPLTAVVDTKGGVISDPSTPVIYYEGPLTLVTGIGQGAFSADADLAYKPFPDAVRVTYGSDAAGQHFQYAHGIGDEVHLNYGTDVNGSNVKYVPGDLPEVDLRTNLTVHNGTETTTYDAAVDRMPRAATLDLGPSSNGAGSADFTSSVDGRAPDVRLSVSDHQPGQRPTNADIKLDGLPQALHAKWALPKNGPASANLSTSGAGIGGVQADIRNYDGTSAVIPAFVPPEEQFLNFQQVGTGPSGPDRRISGRVERVRSLDLQQSDNGLDLRTGVGDGELPMLAHFLTNDRSGTAGSALEGTATVAPMPDTAHVAFTKPATGSTDPLVITYEASEAVDVDGHAEFRHGTSVADAQCGTRDTLCASLAARHMPTKVVANVTNLPKQALVNIDSTLRSGGAHPDLFADAQVGADDNVPLIAHAEVLGAPSHVRILTHEGADQTLDRAEFHACDFNFSTNKCAAGTDGPNDEVGALAFNVRNWFIRPGDLPPPTEATPSFASVVARGTNDPHNVLFEAAGRITDIREVDYRNVNGIAGVRTRVGGGNAFSAHADFANVAFKPSDPVNTIHRYDVLADVGVPKLPSEMDVCFRQTGYPVPAATDAFTAPCENQNPFGDPDNLTTSPVSFAYKANDKFDINTTGRVVDRGVGPANTDVSDDHTIAATVNIHDLPKVLNLDVQAPPKGTDGPLRALFVAPHDPTGPQVSVDTDVREFDADLGCKDPRVPAHGDQAMCIRGKLENLPDTALVNYDPTVATNNLHIHTTGDEQMNLIGFPGDDKAKLSIIKRHETTLTGGKLNHLHGITLKQGVADILIAEGTIHKIPRDLDGTLLLPNSVDLHANPPLGAADFRVQNFIGPDPMPTSLPGPRAGLPTPTENVTFLQRGDFFRADVNVTDLTGAAFATAVDSVTGKQLDTKTLRVDFGNGHTIRAYADILAQADPNVATSLQQIIADVTLPDAPKGISMCFRGPKTAGQGDPAVKGYCDSAPTDNEGAVSVVTDPSADANQLDVDGFIRVAKNGGSDVLATRLDLLNVPRVVQGTFAKDGKSVFGGFKNVDDNGVGHDPDGIDQIKFDLANFDAPGASGFNPVPWEFGHASDINNFPADPGGQNLRLRVSGTAIRAAGTIGNPGGTGQLRSFLLDHAVCAAPDPKPADYDSYFPDGSMAPGTNFTCIKVNFDPGGTPTPLKTDVDVVKDGTHIAFHDGGLSKIPDWVQLTLSSLADPPDKSSPLATPCGPTFTPAAGKTCVPPLIRLDNSGGATVAGVFEAGQPGDLNAIEGMSPLGTMTDLKAIPPLELPGTNNWSDWPENNSNGARVRLATFKTPGDVNSRVAVKAGLRFGIPRSFTLDQVQTWSAEGPQPSTDDSGDDAKDIKFHYVERNGSGAIIGSIGQAAAMINTDDGTQILLNGEDPSLTKGLDIPGDTGVNVYLRHHKVKDDSPESTPGGTVDQLFAQIDGRVNIPLTARARVLTSGGTGINAIVKNVPAYASGDTTDNPSFRLRFEMDHQKKESSIPKGGFWCLFLCLKTDVHPDTIAATFDFANNGQNQHARRVDAVVNLDPPKVAVDVHAFKNIDPAANPSDDQPAEISGGAHVLLAPMDIFAHAELFLLGGNFGLVSELEAGVSINHDSRFRVTSDALHLKAAVEGSGTAKINLDFQPQFLAGEIHSLLASIFGAPPIYTFDYDPPRLPLPLFVDKAQVSFGQCSPIPLPLSFSPGIVNDIDVSPGDGADLYAWLLNDPPGDGPETRFTTGGLLGTAYDFVGRWLTPALCLLPADLSDAIPHTPFKMDAHPIPGEDVGAPPVVPPLDPAPPPPLNLTSGDDPKLCGDHTYSSINIPSGARVDVATVADGANCAAADAGTLNLRATGDATIGGIVAAAPDSTKTVTLTAGSIHVLGSGRVFGTLGALQLASAGNVTIDPGAMVRAQGVAPGTTGGTAATGTSGAGHGGAGGLSGGASPGTPGTTYGDLTISQRDDGSVPAENGSVGAGAAGDGFGNGGGVVEIAGDRITIQGSVDVSGQRGDDDSTAGLSDCAVTAPPANVKPNTGKPGHGGGSGGDAVLAGRVIDLTGGSVLAEGGGGGRGTAGGGGGGGGGVVKVIAPVLIGSPNIGGGGGGSNQCPSDTAFQDGMQGVDGQLIRAGDPTSHVAPLDRLWNHNGDDVFTFNTLAAAPSLPGNKDFTVFVCGSWRPPQAISAGDTNFGIDMPTANSLGAPCGVQNNAPPTQEPGDSVIQQLNAKTFTNTEATPDDLTFTPPSMPEGFWGIYSVVVKSGYKNNGLTNNCFDPTDNLDDPANIFSGGQYDNEDCHLEAVPQHPDATVAVDNSDPALANPTLPGLEHPRTKNQFVTLDLSAPDTMSQYGYVGPDLFGKFHIQTIGGDKLQDTSGTDQYECSNDDFATFLPCQAGLNQWRLSDGSGMKTISVRAFDRAGNGGDVKTVDVELDNTPPDSQAQFDGPFVPDGSNGWFHTSPKFKIFGYDDHGAPDAEPGKTVYQWWFDSGSPDDGTAGVCPLALGTAAADTTCEVNPTLSDGQHTFHWQAIDALENAEPPHTIAFKIDRNRPKSQLISSPELPDGNNHWYTTAPWVVVSAVDPPGGSGMVNAASDSDKTAGIYYQVNANGHVGAVNGPIKPADFEPIHLDAGSTDVCWQVIDGSGWADLQVFGSQCQHYDVDVQNPTASLTPSGTTGDNGWFTSLVPVAASGADQGVGSGVDPSLNPPFDLCDPHPDSTPMKPSGVCYSIDHLPFRPYSTLPIVIGEGLHDVRAYSIDRAGRHSQTVDLPLQSDRSHPVSTLRTMPSAPAMNGWFRTKPTVVLRAVDGTRNAGLRLERYRIDGGNWITYSDPFTIDEGHHDVDYQALDLSGTANDESIRSAHFDVDLTPPVAKALSPAPLIWSKLLSQVVLPPIKLTVNVNLVPPITLVVTVNPLAVPAKAQLNYQVSDNLSHSVHVFVIVYNELGTAVRRIDGGVVAVTPGGAPTSGYVEWDGTDQSLTGLVGVGLYHYRVVAIDEAGNRTQTGESKPLQIKIL